MVPTTEPCALSSTQPLKVSTRDFILGKGGRCVWPTTYPHLCRNVKKIRGLNLPGTPWATSACRGRPLPLLYLNHSILQGTFEVYFSHGAISTGPAHPLMCSPLCGSCSKSPNVSTAMYYDSNSVSRPQRTTVRALNFQNNFYERLK